MNDSSLLNDLSVMPTGVQGVYPGTSNFAPPPSDPVDETPSATMPEGSKGDVVEGAPGVIESTQLAPLGEGKVADDPVVGIQQQVTNAAKGIYEAVVGKGE